MFIYGVYWHGLDEGQMRRQPPVDVRIPPRGDFHFLKYKMRIYPGTRTGLRHDSKEVIRVVWSVWWQLWRQEEVTYDHLVLAYRWRYSKLEQRYPMLHALVKFRGRGTRIAEDLYAVGPYAEPKVLSS